MEIKYRVKVNGDTIARFAFADDALFFMRERLCESSLWYGTLSLPVWYHNRATASRTQADALDVIRRRIEQHSGTATRSVAVNSNPLELSND